MRELCEILAPLNWGNYIFWLTVLFECRLSVQQVYWFFAGSRYSRIARIVRMKTPGTQTGWGPPEPGYNPEDVDVDVPGRLLCCRSAGPVETRSMLRAAEDQQAGVRRKAPGGPAARQLPTVRRDCEGAEGRYMGMQPQLGAGREFRRNGLEFSSHGQGASSLGLKGSENALADSFQPGQVLD